ncbi:MAG: LytR C-terminal domain-containing protein [Actinomycetota bacterium]|nr:LytR C-terminal domain-containing protein [Actinomycetota bacterium]
MGRHSAGDKWAFHGSVTRWALPWILLAALVGLGLWFVMRPEGGELRAQPPQKLDQGSSPAPTPSSTPNPEPEPTEKEDEAGAARRPLITDDVTVQVLDAAGSPEAQDRMVGRLAALGFAVPFEAEASMIYRDTTVYWSFPEAKAAARRLAGRFGWKSGARPSNLSPDVTVHVVVGRDEAQG